MDKVVPISAELSEAENFEKVLGPHLQFLYRLAYRFTGKVADAEDLVQDVLVKVYLHRNNLTEIDKLRAWLAKVLYRTFLDQQRKFWRSPLSLLKTKREPDDPEVLDGIASSNPGPDAQLETKVKNDQLRAAIRCLNVEQRVVCVLHDIEGYPLPELEDILETPLGTLKSRLHRARGNLRKKLLLGTL